MLRSGGDCQGKRGKVRSSVARNQGDDIRLLASVRVLWMGRETGRCRWTPAGPTVVSSGGERTSSALPQGYGRGAGGGGGAAEGGAGGAGGMALGGGGGLDEGAIHPGGGGGGMATQVPRDGVCTTTGTWLPFEYMHCVYALS